MRYHAIFFDSLYFDRARLPLNEVLIEGIATDYRSESSDLLIWKDFNVLLLCDIFSQQIPYACYEIQMSKKMTAIEEFLDNVLVYCGKNFEKTMIAGDWIRSRE